MKNYLLLLLIGAFCTVSCKSTDKTSPYFVSSNAHSLIDSYRDLVAQTNTKDCIYDNSASAPKDSIIIAKYHCMFSAMPAKGYNKGTGGYITFSSLYFYEHTNPKSTVTFRTHWYSDSLQAIASICRDCFPKPLVNPFEKTDNIDNQSYEVILVPVADYQNGNHTESTFVKAEEATNPFNTIQIKAADIKAINDVYLESDSEYMNTHLATKYIDSRSSVGVICEVLLKTDKIVKCYVFNNYEGGTLTWKVKKSN